MGNLCRTPLCRRANFTEENPRDIALMNITNIQLTPCLPSSAISNPNTNDERCATRHAKRFRHYPWPLKEQIDGCKLSGSHTEIQKEAQRKGAVRETMVQLYSMSEGNIADDKALALEKVRSVGAIGDKEKHEVDCVLVG